MKVYNSGSVVKQKAKHHILKNRQTPTKVEFVHKYLRGKRYMYRFVDPHWGIVFGFNKDVNESSNIVFDKRMRTGRYGWDMDRGRMHIYSINCHKTDKVYRWNWRWYAYGYSKN